MNNLIDKDSFSGLTALVGMGQTWNNSDLDSYITMYQEVLLKRFLGESLYNLLDANYTESSGDKWDKLVNGETYTKDYAGSDFTIKYKGLKEMLTYFIYFFYKSELASSPTEGGEVISNYSNSTHAKIDRKIIKAFNLGVDLLGEIVEFDSDVEYIDGVGDYPFFTHNISKDSYKATLFNYITYKNGLDSTTYPNWIFKGYNKINELGI